MGCGTSSGVPNLRSGWGRCDPDEPKNRRMRSSVLFESAGERLLVDCGPDLRQQLLDAGSPMVDALLLTHDHADHSHGIDELRPIVQTRGEPLPFLARPDVIEQMKRRFAYAFVDLRYYAALYDPKAIENEFMVGDARVRVVDQPHGGITSLGLRFDKGGKSIAYAIDFNEITDTMATLYNGVDVWVADCLMLDPHPTHAHLDMVLDAAREFSVGQLLLTHMGNGMDYATLKARLPDWAAPAHDGLEVEF
nr:MBL fold metallo-hydrolase [Sphingomicrobium nitratireducens]